VAEVSLPEAIHIQPGRCVPFARPLIDGQAVSRERRFPTRCKFKDLDLPQAEIRHAGERARDQEFQRRLKARTFAWAVALQVPSGVWVEDDYLNCYRAKRVK
jgi:hypothetical protein